MEKAEVAEGLPLSQESPALTPMSPSSESASWPRPGRRTARVWDSTDPAMTRTIDSEENKGICSPERRGKQSSGCDTSCSAQPLSLPALALEHSWARGSTEPPSSFVLPSSARREEPSTEGSSHSPALRRQRWHSHRPGSSVLLQTTKGQGRIRGGGGPWSAGISRQGLGCRGQAKGWSREMLPAFPPPGGCRDRPRLCRIQCPCASGPVD